MQPDLNDQFQAFLISNVKAKTPVLRFLWSRFVLNLYNISTSCSTSPQQIHSKCTTNRMKLRLQAGDNARRFIVGWGYGWGVGRGAQDPLSMGSAGFAPRKVLNVTFKPVNVGVFWQFLKACSWWLRVFGGGTPRPRQLSPDKKLTNRTKLAERE